MWRIDQYLDLGYTSIVRETQSPAGETVVCRDRRKRCFRLTVSWTDQTDRPRRLKIERTEIVSEKAYQKTLAEQGGVLDTESVHQARSRRRMTLIAAQHELAMITPVCPLCGKKMKSSPPEARWICPSAPACPGQKKGEPQAFRRYAELVRLLYAND